MLNHKAMLMTLSISQWTARKHDKHASSEIEKNHGAKNAGRFNKLLVDADALKPIASAASALRDYHNTNTLPWTDDGRRLLPSKLFMTYTQNMRQLKDTFNTRVREFVNEYPGLVQAARLRLGTLYDPQDYPDASRIMLKFSVNIDPEPVPSANDFRVDMGETEMARVRQEVEEAVRGRQQKAVNDLFERVREVVGVMHERLSDPKAVFRDSLVDNVRSLHGLIPALNLTDDQLLIQLHKEMEPLAAVSPRTLRMSTFKRREIDELACRVLSLLPTKSGD